ncbi:MAG TPA: DUF3142 domain-containing protein [Pyrinomonadaceae bacterium]|nr:DUF3142 domain-containing protein [Pyrinomonadaceae bacterium]
MQQAKFWILAVVALAMVVALEIKLQLWTVASTSPENNASRRLVDFAGIVLWAWERPEDLRFIDPDKTAVAFLAKTIHLRGDKVVSRPRLQPLRVPDSALLIAVARIETDGSEFPSLSRDQLSRVIAEIVTLAQTATVAGIQIDFDATVSERTFYRNLILELRARLPPSLALSITALASWCQGDNWLTDLPVDEAVPMLFRLGADREQIRRHLASGKTFASDRCRKTAGVSVDEPLAQLPRVDRLYVFNPAPWSSNAVNSLMKAYE